MTYTDGQIKAAIEAWADAQVDESIASQIKNTLEYIEKYPDRTYYRDDPTDPADFDREEIRDELISEYYSEGKSVELPGLGLATVVQQDRVNDEQWIVLEIDGLYYMNCIYYSSYGEDYWQDEGTFVRVTPHQKTITEYKPV